MPGETLTLSSADPADSQPEERIDVEGARKVWGTHPHATSRTVENAISRFCLIQGLRIRRKTSTNGRRSWWFVIHADETVLCELDKKWDSVNVQTNWILKHCTKPASAVVPANDTPSVINNALESGVAPVNTSNSTSEVGDAAVTANTDAPEPPLVQSNHEQSRDQLTDQLSPTTKGELTAPQQQSLHSQQ